MVKSPVLVGRVCDVARGGGFTGAEQKGFKDTLFPRSLQIPGGNCPAAF